MIRDFARGTAFVTGSSGIGLALGRDYACCLR